MHNFTIPTLEDEQQSYIYTFVEFIKCKSKIIDKAKNGNLSYELELLNKLKGILNNCLILSNQTVNSSQELIQLLSKYRDLVEEIIDLNRKNGKWEDF